MARTGLIADRARIEEIGLAIVGGQWQMPLRLQVRDAADANRVDTAEWRDALDVMFPNSGQRANFLDLLTRGIARAVEYALTTRRISEEVAQDPSDPALWVERVKGTFQIGGVVSTLDGQPLAGVTMTLSTGGTAATDALGRYRFASLVPGEYTITPGLPGVEFTPANRVATITDGDARQRNFVAAPVQEEQP
jgi:hypothetical protein